MPCGHASHPLYDQLRKTSIPVQMQKLMYCAYRLVVCLGIVSVASADSFDNLPACWLPPAAAPCACLRGAFPWAGSCPQMKRHGMLTHCFSTFIILIVLDSKRCLEEQHVSTHLLAVLHCLPLPLASCHLLEPMLCII
jgi:hypothetical protein